MAMSYLQVFVVITISSLLTFSAIVNICNDSQAILMNHVQGNLLQKKHQINCQQSPNQNFLKSKPCYQLKNFQANLPNNSHNQLLIYNLKAVIAAQIYQIKMAAIQKLRIYSNKMVMQEIIVCTEQNQTLNGQQAQKYPIFIQAKAKIQNYLKTLDQTDFFFRNFQDGWILNDSYNQDIENLFPHKNSKQLTPWTTRSGVIQIAWLQQHQNGIYLKINLSNGKYNNEEIRISLNLLKQYFVSKQQEQAKLIQFTPSAATYTIESKGVQIQYFYTEDSQHMYQINNLGLQIKLSFKQKPIILLKLYSDNQVALTINVDKQNFRTHIFFQSMGFALIYLMLQILTLVHAAKQIKAVEEQQALADKVSVIYLLFFLQLSLITICIHAFWDLMGGMIFSTLSSLYRISTSIFLVSSITHFILFVYADLRLLVIVWLTRLRNSNSDSNAIRQKCLKFFIYFCKNKRLQEDIFIYVVFLDLSLILIVYITQRLIFKYKFLGVSIFLPLWIPQIVVNVLSASKKVPILPYFYAITALRLFPYLILQLYIFSYPENLILNRPSQDYTIAGCVIFSLQILIIQLQYSFGGRFFIPKSWWPGYFQYERKFITQDLLNEQGDIGLQECIICMQALRYQPEDGGHRQLVEEQEVNQSSRSKISDTQQPALQNTLLDDEEDKKQEEQDEQDEKKQKEISGEIDQIQRQKMSLPVLSSRGKKIAKQYMQTPCAHRYHKKCLSKWLQMREQCPICRTKIPAYF